MVIAATSKIQQNGAGWYVPSQSGKGKYHVTTDKQCNCPDYELRGLPCKHVLAVHIVIRREGGGKPSVAVTVTESVTPTPTCSQNWPAYNRAQQEEKARVRILLRELVDTIPQPEQTSGRPRLPLADIVFASVYRTFDRISSRRFATAMNDLRRDGFVSTVPHFNSLTNYLRRPDLEPIFTDLITASALPLAAVETDFAVDSSGFTTRRFDRWFDHKYGKGGGSRKWIKAHIMVGTRTNVVTSVEVTPGTAADSKSFPSLVESTAKHFHIEEVSADKAYSSRANLAVIEKVGAVPYVAFKNNTAAVYNEDTAWARSYHQFCLHREDFLVPYHKRSNVETTFAMIKAKFGDSLLSKSEQGQMNEVLCKVLAHNICCVVSAIHELGIEPVFSASNASRV